MKTAAGMAVPIYYTQPGAVGLLIREHTASRLDLLTSVTATISQGRKSARTVAITGRVLVDRTYSRLSQDWLPLPATSLRLVQ